MYELLIDLDSNAGMALYEQIYEYIRHDIMDGRLSCGERLPSTRLLASSLQVSRSTVELSYEQLVSEGYLEARRGSGYYVCDIGGLYDLSRISRRSPSASPFQAVSAAQAGEPIQPSEIRYNFSPGQVDHREFPYNAWRRAIKEALLELEQGLLAAGPPQGEYELRRVIASYLYGARGVRCIPEQIIIGAGNEYLLQLLSQILDGRRSIAMESPTYLQACHTFQNMGYEITAVSMDGDGMRVEQIPEEEISLVYVMPSHQFPLGCVMPFRRRMQLLAWAERHPYRYIIEDDHDSEFRYKGKPIPSLHSMAHQDRVIYLGTFSNSIMPSIRISYMVLPPQLMEAYHRTCGFYASTVSRIQQTAVCRFMQSGSFERHLNKMRGVYKRKHDILMQLLKGKEWVRRIYGNRAGLHIAVELNCSASEEEIIERARRHGLAVQGMSECYIREKPVQNPVLLLGFGSLSEKEIREGAAVLEQCIQE